MTRGLDEIERDVDELMARVSAHLATGPLDHGLVSRLRAAVRAEAVRLGPPPRRVVDRGRVTRTLIGIAAAGLLAMALGPWQTGGDVTPPSGWSGAGIAADSLEDWLAAAAESGETMWALYHGAWTDSEGDAVDSPLDSLERSFDEIERMLGA